MRSRRFLWIVAVLLLLVWPAAAGAETYHILTEDASGAILLETGTDFLITEAGCAGISHVQSAGADAASVALPGAVTAGNLIVVGVGNNAAQTVTGVTDTLSNTYVQAVTLGDSNQRVSIWYARNITGGAAPTITATFSAPTGNNRIAAAEYSGADQTASVLNGTNSKTNASTTTPDSNAVTPTADGALFTGLMTPNTVAVVTTPGTNFTERFESATDGWEYEDRVQVTAASLAASWTLDVADPASCVVAVFIPAACAAVASPQRSLLGVGQ